MTASDSTAQLVSALALLSTSLEELNRCQVAFLLNRCSSEFFDAAILDVRTKKEAVRRARAAYMESLGVTELPLSAAEVARLREMKVRVKYGEFSEGVVA